jgi:hypothetical protein
MALTENSGRHDVRTSQSSPTPIVMRKEVLPVEDLLQIRRLHSAEDWATNEAKGAARLYVPRSEAPPHILVAGEAALSRRSRGSAWSDMPRLPRLKWL